VAQDARVACSKILSPVVTPGEIDHVFARARKVGRRRDLSLSMFLAARGEVFESPSAVLWFGSEELM